MKQLKKQHEITERCRKHLGCWIDTENRAISGGHVNFDTSIVVDKCHDRAVKRGNSVFAVQFWTECFTAPDAEKTYHKYGQATNCQDGVGRDWANDVYKIIPCKPGYSFFVTFSNIILRTRNNND